MAWAQKAIAWGYRPWLKYWKFRRGMICGGVTGFKALMQREELPAFLITHPPNCRYLSGFTGSSGVLLVTEDSSYLITDSRYREQARREAAGFTIILREGALAPELQSLLEEKGLERLGFEGEYLPFSSYNKFASVAEWSWFLQVDWWKASGGKDEVEIGCCAGAALADEAFNYILVL